MAAKRTTHPVINRSIHRTANSTYNAAEDRTNNTVGKRLASARREAHLTMDELAGLLKPLGVNVKKGAISKWEKGETLPSVYQLIAVCSALDIDEGLTFFMGDCFVSPRLNAEGQKKVAEYKDDLIASGRYRPVYMVRDNIIKYVTMPVSMLGASAGTGEYLSDENFTHEEFPEGSVPDGADFGVRVHGDSMEPVYHDGQIAWVRRCETLCPGEVGLFIYDGDGYIKVYGEQEPDEDDQEAFTDSLGQVHMQPVLISYNKEYPPSPVRPETRFQIAGRIL